MFEFFDSKSLAPDSPPPAVQMLVRERVDAWSTGPVSVAIGRVILGPGARVFPPGGETLFVAVESGTLALTGRNARTVAAGMGMMEPPGLDRALRNAGPGLSALLVLTVAPAAE